MVTMREPSPSSALPSADDRGFPASGSGRDLALLAGMVAIAFAVRLVPVLRGGGLFGSMKYDDGVYFGAAVAMLGGRIPYHDFLLLHPPGILLVLAPFAALGNLIGDPAAFAAARVAFMVLGALNVVLVTLVASRAGRRAALAAGALYVVWEVAANVERTTWLVGPQSTLLLLALLALAGPRGRTAVAQLEAVRGCGRAPRPQRRDPGVGRRAARGRARAGWSRSIGASCGPRSVPSSRRLSAPASRWRSSGARSCSRRGSDMIRYVILDQAGRTLTRSSIVVRMRYMEGLPLRSGIGPPVPDVVVIGAFVVAVLAVAWMARRRPVARLWVALLAAQVGVLFLAPPLAHYAGWLAPTAALAAGCVFDTALTWAGSRQRIATGLRVTFAVGLVVLLGVSTLRPVGTRLSLGRLDADLAGERCVTADSPTLLIETGALARDLQAGCPLMLDPTGTSYDAGRRTAIPAPASTLRTRPRWRPTTAAAMPPSSPASRTTRSRPARLRRSGSACPWTRCLGPVTVMIDGDDH